VILIGDTGVGKTSIRKRYLGEGFKKDYLITLGVDLAVKKFDSYRIQIWDIAGHHSFRKVILDYYRGTHGILLIFSLVDRQSLANLEAWLLQAQEILGSPLPVPIVVLANKSDLIADRVLIENEILNHLNSLKNHAEYNLQLIYTSALTGQNIDQAFQFIVDSMVENTKPIEY
jgi:Ras-related protein Rab-1A